MDLISQRVKYLDDGVFSEVTTMESAEIFMRTCEHSYEDNQPIVKPGKYLCVRGKHRLHGMDHDFETFEVTGVEGHSGILFHWGNYNGDSQGCILTGATFAQVEHDPNRAGLEDMVTNSKATFQKFMDLQEGVDQFYLTVLE